MKQLSLELDTLTANHEKIYYVFDMGIPGVIFIKVIDWVRPFIDIKKIGLAIVEHVKDTKEALSRFACRFMPVEFLCKANIDDFKIFIAPVVQKLFTGKERVLWCMEFKRRNNDRAVKKDYFNVLETLINRLDHPISYDEAD